MKAACELGSEPSSGSVPICRGRCSEGITAERYCVRSTVQMAMAGSVCWGHLWETPLKMRHPRGANPPTVTWETTRSIGWKCTCGNALS